MTSPASLAERPAAAKTPLILVLVGPPGCGKGTQAERLSQKFGIPAISTGELIRAEIKAGTALGKIAQGITMTGGLLSDDLVNEIVASRVGQPDCAGGFLLDGYPRSIAQAEFLASLLEKKGLPQPLIVHIEIPGEQLISRICMRRSCAQCGHIYNLLTHPPASGNRCDVCGGDLQQRPDDCEDTVRNRLAAYQKSTAPLIAHYNGPRYRRVDGAGPPDAVFGAILKALA